MIIYKYLDIEGMKRVLENNSVLLKNPYNFNDPFDCKIEKELINFKKCSELVMNYATFKAIYSMINTNYMKISNKNKNIILFLKKEFDIYKSAFEIEPYYPKIHLLNYFLKLSLKIDPNLKIQIEKEISNFEKNMNKAIDELIENTYICCFSKKNDSILMWSHYAENHKGACFEFDSLEDNSFFEVEYSKKRVNFNLEKALRTVCAYDFIGRKLDIVNDNTIREIMKYALTKSNNWKYEEEVRCIYYSSNKLLFKHEKGYLLNMGKIKRIYLGCKMSDEDKKYMEEHSNGIDIVEMKASKKEFKIFS